MEDSIVDNIDVTDELTDVIEDISLMSDLCAGLASSGTHPRAQTMRAASRLLDSVGMRLEGMLGTR